jgi:hypothetical protein
MLMGRFRCVSASRSSAARVWREHAEGTCCLAAVFAVLHTETSLASRNGRVISRAALQLEVVRVSLRGHARLG